MPDRARLLMVPVGAIHVCEQSLADVDSASDAGEPGVRQSTATSELV
jgi:hypothetical protein